MIKYDEPRTWWRASRWTAKPEPHNFVGETEKFLVDHRGRKTAKNSDFDTYYDTKEKAEAVIASREAAAQKAIDDRNRQAAALAACEGMTTEQLTPGCVAKLVEALEWIQERSTSREAIQRATAALAAMKGV